MYKLCLLIHIFECIILSNEGVQGFLMLFSNWHIQICYDETSKLLCCSLYVCMYYVYWAKAYFRNSVNSQNIWSHNLCLWQSKVAGILFVLHHKEQWHISTVVCHLYFVYSKMFVDDFSAVFVYCVYTFKGRHSQTFYLGLPEQKLNSGPRGSKSTHILYWIYMYMPNVTVRKLWGKNSERQKYNKNNNNNNKKILAVQVWHKLFSFVFTRKNR